MEKIQFIKLDTKLHMVQSIHKLGGYIKYCDKTRTSVLFHS